MASKNEYPQLSAEQVARIERNRQKALLRQQKCQRNLTTDEVYQLEKYAELKVKHDQDTGGGFFIESNDDEKMPYLIDNASTSNNKTIFIKNDTKNIVCDECEDNFSNSFLLSNFGENICDLCKDLKRKHQLITKTEAKQEYLLNDTDLDKREPPLRCIVKKNPYKYARGMMKLYLRLQVEERALEVWQSEELLEKERKIRETKRETRKQKNFDKEMKKLRMETRSSLFQKKLNSARHEHEYDEGKPIENLNDPDGQYFEQICKICGIKNIYEKL